MSSHCHQTTPDPTRQTCRICWGNTSSKGPFFIAMLVYWSVYPLEGFAEDAWKKFQKYWLPNGGEKMVMNPMGSQSVKNHQQNKSQDNTVYPSEGSVCMSYSTKKYIVLQKSYAGFRDGRSSILLDLEGSRVLGIWLCIFEYVTVCVYNNTVISKNPDPSRSSRIDGMNPILMS